MEYVASTPEDYLPVEFAIKKLHDDTASMLMGRMYGPRSVV